MTFAVDRTVTFSSPVTGAGFAFGGIARRYPHVFRGVLASQCGGVAFFKVHPVASQ